MQTNALGRPAPAEGERSPTDQVLHNLMSVGRLLRQQMSNQSLDFGLFWLLKNLDEHGGLRVTELASRVDLDPSTVSRHVAQLEKLGLVERTPDPLDGRAQVVALTEPGLDQLRAAYDHRRELLVSGLADFASEDVDHLSRLLTHFVHNIETTRNLEHA